MKSGGEPHSRRPCPPRKYWRVGYRNERGRQAVEDWYNGFEHGARVANEGGYRDRAVVPSSLYASAAPRSEVRGTISEPTEALPMEPTPAERPAQLEMPVTAKPVNGDTPINDKSVDVASAEEEVPAEKPQPEPESQQPETKPIETKPIQTKPIESTSEKPRSVIPVVFERPDSEPRQVHPTWGDKPPAPPWHADAQGNAKAVSSKDDATGEFDPYDGSIIAGPAAAPRPNDSDSDSADKHSDDKSDASETDGASVPAFTEKQVEEAPSKTSKGRDTVDDGESDESDATDKDAGWQSSKHEPTEWKSRR